MENKIKILIDNLKKRSFKPEYFETSKEALQFILNLIPKDVSVGFGGSKTASQIGIGDALKERGNKVNSHALIPPEEREKLYDLARCSSFYISSVNAITENGDILNTDGTANRISSLAFGPKNIIYVLGRNKIVKNIEEGFKRIEEIAAPLNCERFNLPIEKGINYESNQNICNATLIVHRPTRLQETVYVIIINEELGF